MILSIANNLTTLDGVQQTYLGSTVIAGNTSSLVRNPAGFNTNWMIQFGQTGEENAEILPLSSVSGTVMNYGTSASNPGGTFLYPHALDTPLYQIHYDQIVINRSTTGSTGVFSPIGTTNITPDNQYTNYNDANGASGYAYYVQYYNSVNGDLSGSSSIFIPGGPSFYSLQKIRQRVKDKLYSAGYIREDSIYTDWINEWYEQMTNAAIKVNQAYMLGSVSIPFGTNGYGTVTATDFKQPFKLEITTDGTTYIPSHSIPLQEFSELDSVHQWDWQHSWRGELLFELLPHGQIGTALLTYGQRFAPLVNDSDQLTNTLTSYTTSCVEYCLAVAYGLDQKDADYQLHQQNYMQSKQDFIDEVTPRDQTGPQMIQIIDSISGMEEDVVLGEEFYSW